MTPSKHKFPIQNGVNLKKKIMKIGRLINNSNSMKSSLKKRDLKSACSKKKKTSL